MTKELLDKANILNNKIVTLNGILEDIKENNSPITIQTGMVHNFQLDYPRERTEPLEVRTYDLIVEVIESYLAELNKKFSILSEEG